MKLRGQDLEVLRSFDAETNAIRDDFRDLWGGVVDLFFVEGIELGVLLRGSGDESNDELGLATGYAELHGGRRGFGDEGERLAEGTGGLGGSGSAGGNS